MAGCGSPVVARLMFGGGLYVVEVGLEVLCVSLRKLYEA